MCDGVRFVYQGNVIAFISICILTSNSNNIIYYIVLQIARVAVPPPLLAIGSRPSPKWLNIVLDLNGVLCQCVERSIDAQHGHMFQVDQHLYSLHFPT